jgi:hypothetical protein
MNPGDYEGSKPAVAETNIATHSCNVNSNVNNGPMESPEEREGDATH